MLYCVLFTVLCATAGVRGGVSNAELKRFSEELFSSDTNNVFGSLILDKGGRAQYGESNVDRAVKPLIAPFNASTVLNGTTFGALVNFYNNYIPDVRKEEYHTKEEHQEQVFFIDSIMLTQPMQKVRQILVNKGFVSDKLNDFKRRMKSLWFDFYSRRGNKLGSSGFEHVLLGEIKNGAVTGFHNWVYFYFLERTKEINYLGYKKFLSLGRREAAAVKFTFKWKHHLKPVTSMLVGTSPEFELALYTLCFHVRHNRDCDVQLGGKQLVVKTHSYRTAGKNGEPGKTVIGSAYVDL